MSHGNDGKKVLRSCVPIVEGNIQVCTLLERYIGYQCFDVHCVGGDYLQASEAVPDRDSTSRTSESKLCRRYLQVYMFKRTVLFQKVQKSVQGQRETGPIVEEG